MTFISAILVSASLLTVVYSDCSEFGQWKTCSKTTPQSQINNSVCKYNSSAKVLIVNEGEKFSVICFNNTFPDNVFDCFPFNYSNHLILINCSFPQTTFDRFFSNSNLRELTISFPNSSILQTSIYVRNLPQIQFLSLKNLATFSYFELILSSLPRMKSIKISNFTFTSLPVKPFQELAQLKGLALTRGILETLPDDFLFGTNLRSLDLSVNRLEKFQPNLIKSMTELRKLNLSYNLLETIDANLYTNALTLQTISLDNNRISFLPPMLFKTSPNIKILLLNHNKLREIPDNIFQGLTKLQFLSLSHNRLNILPPNVLNGLRSLILLDLQSNQFHSLPENLFISQNRLYGINLSNNRISSFASTAPFGNNKHLVNVNLSNNCFKDFPYFDWTLYNISQLDLSNNSIRQVSLPISTEPGGLIFLQHNQIRNVKVINNLTSNYFYVLSGNPFECTCNLSEFVNNLKMVPDANKLICQEPWYRANKYINEFVNNTELCEVNNDCPPECKCHLLANNKVEVNCRNVGMKSAAISLPYQTTILHLENNKISSLSDVECDTWINLTHLYLSNNSLTSLENWTVPPKLQVMAVDGNNLVNLSSSIMTSVNESKDFSIYLKGNNWPCDCQSISLKKWIMDNLSKVKDSSLTYCKTYDDNSISSISRRPLEEFVCLDTSYSSRLHNNCANLEIHVYIIFFFLGTVNKMCF